MLGLWGVSNAMLLQGHDLQMENCSYRIITKTTWYWQIGFNVPSACIIFSTTIRPLVPATQGVSQPSPLCRCRAGVGLRSHGISVFFYLLPASLTEPLSDPCSTTWKRVFFCPSAIFCFAGGSLFFFRFLNYLRAFIINRVPRVNTQSVESLKKRDKHSSSTRDSTQ